MADFIEVADRVLVARYEWLDVNVTAVGSDRGLMVVDTHSSGLAASSVIDDLRRLGAGEVTRVVNTHSHFDHTFGNSAFRSAYGDIVIHAHENAAASTLASGERIKGVYRDDPDDPHREEVLATEMAPADHTFSSAVSLDLGDRVVELVHPGRGHTDGDIVVRVPDVDVVLAGDLVEESAAPVYGVDSFPLDWPHSMDVVLGLTTSASTVVPGHGAPVDRDFVEVQRADLDLMADAIRALAGRGVPLDQALEVGDFPFPADGLANALLRGYEQLPAPSRRAAQPPRNVGR